MIGDSERASEPILDAKAALRREFERSEAALTGSLREQERITREQMETEERLRATFEKLKGITWTEGPLQRAEFDELVEQMEAMANYVEDLKRKEMANKITIDLFSEETEKILQYLRSFESSVRPQV